jgi:hypothetical protein
MSGSYGKCLLYWQGEPIACLSTATVRHCNRRNAIVAMPHCGSSTTYVEGTYGSPRQLFSPRPERPTKLKEDRWITLSKDGQDGDIWCVVGIIVQQSHVGSG